MTETTRDANALADELFAVYARSRDSQTLTFEEFDLLADAVTALREMESELAGYKRWASSVNEALNTGDGSYKP